MRLCPQALAKPLQVFASVRERWRVSRILGIRKWPRIHTELSFFGNCHRDREGLGRKTQICRHFWTRTWSPRFNSVHNHKDRGVLVTKRRCAVSFGLAFGRRVLKVATVTRIGRVLVAKRRSVVTSWSPHVKSVNNHKDRRVLVAKRRTIVSFGLALGRKMATITGIGGSLSQKAELSSLLDSRLVNPSAEHSGKITALQAADLRR